ncbi:MAG: hypothetical protein ACRCYU_23000 [Nocardioides sp.]
MRSREKRLQVLYAVLTCLGWASDSLDRAQRPLEICGGADDLDEELRDLRACYRDLEYAVRRQLSILTAKGGER